MNKTAIKNFAIWARVTLIEAVKQRAYEYEITKDGVNNASLEAVGGRILSRAERDQRRALINEISGKGFDQVMEEAAYTWFNRFIALRFMEVNGYLPARVRVFTNEEGEFKPEIMKEAMTVEIDGLKRDIVLDLIDKQNNEELFKYLIITQCNALGKGLPKMFERIEHWTELLFPANLLRADSVVGKMVTEIPEEDWQDAVQIIGWLYQYYNTELKDDTFEKLKKNIKISKERIPAATQLFTPDWIVRYMVENSLGRIYISDQLSVASGQSESERIEAEKAIAEKMGWRYYLPEAEQTPEVRAQLITNHLSLATRFDVRDIKVIDPCMGSGHILVYAFDVLMQIYTSAGWSERDAAKSIVENNLYGLDIDDRAGQLAYFAVMMKARQYNRRALAGGVAGVLPNVYSIQESNNISRFAVEDFCNGDAKALEEMDKLLRVMRDAKEYGSILNIKDIDFDLLFAKCDAAQDHITISQREIQEDIIPLIRIAYVIAQKYNVVITNPPYMSLSGASAKLSEYVKRNYPDSKTDLFAVFIERCAVMLKKYGYQAMITMHAWMFLSSYEKLREKLLERDAINMVHLGARAFEEISGEVVQTVSFVLRNSQSNGFKATYCRLTDPNTQSGKEEMFLRGENQYHTTQSNFSKISGSPIAYWVSKSVFKTFDFDKISSVSEGRIGLATGRNDYYLRFWYEVDFDNIGMGLDRTSASKSLLKWFPYNKGGSFRKWYGNKDYVINWESDGKELQHTMHPDGHRIWAHNFNLDYIFKKHISWSDINTGMMSFRCFEKGFLFDSSGTAAFTNEKYFYYLLAFLNTKFVNQMSKILNPTIHFTPGDYSVLPFKYQEDVRIDEFAKSNIELCKEDWDSFEISWDFYGHPFVKYANSLWDATAIGATMSYYYGGHKEVRCPLELCYLLWQGECNERFKKLKENEEELNRIFIDIYGLQDELTPEVEDKDVTVRKADLARDIRSFISYAIGCIFGRYSLDVEGLCYAGGDFSDQWLVASDERGNKGYYLKSVAEKTSHSELITNHLAVDYDGILPICDDEYFEDDIVGKFINFVKVVYGADTLEENLKFIASALGGRGTAREVIRSYFLNDFYADHLKIYQKRPIYWMFDSGKKNGFKALIYMHRYQPDLLARMRTDYVHEQQERYRTQMEAVEEATTSASPSEKVKLTKKLELLRAQSLEIGAFEEKIHHLADMMISIDLDDGVKVNYAKFEEVLAKIK